MAAVQEIPLEDRSAFKYALAATLVKNHAHWRAFETVFEVYFSHRGSEYGIGEDGEFDPPPSRSPRTMPQGRETVRGRARTGRSGREPHPRRAGPDALPVAAEGRPGDDAAAARQSVKRYAEWNRAGPWAAPTTSTAP
ncbi:MAG: hypothetical protein R2716_00710 [Microthrixaceae bacterium]